MPQLIMSSDIKGEFASFVIDTDDNQLSHTTCKDILEIISMKIKIPTERLYIKSTNGKRITLKNIDNIKFDINSYRMQYSNSNVKNNDYWFSFGTKI
tara:strand:- start:719 stop:1009 length:291 start_codon:yes stop_codon:yes gene_type:complete